ncbi:Qat anti-phage system QueC-like protein QatC [Methylosinus sp. RM1]|uniref:Qat anti-phage system QueC-like protein QatC n=1 Tax=Methylosinus sp. RM1 TaxID=2583817 RepID=UPI00140E532F|nr:Qat anti-phage system QueC-like protein QatC [Methylosinus sp. RM1]
MRIAVVPNDSPLPPTAYDARMSLFEFPKGNVEGYVGSGVRREFRKQIGRTGATHAWDLTGIAMAVIAADRYVNRARVSEDGWTRMIDIVVAVSDPVRWDEERSLLERMFRFLTGDIWTIRFIGGGFHPAPPRNPVGSRPETCVSLLSGGLDSLIGAIDLQAKSETPYFISNRVSGECGRQYDFAAALGARDRLLSLNHNAKTLRGNPEISQRPRSLAFIAFAVLAATTLDRHRDGEIVDLYVPENGFISLNVPLTRLRVGSLSTRTTHPVFLADMQELLDRLDLRIRLINPYRWKTKGEMMVDCLDQTRLQELAPHSMSCGRGGRIHTHCGACLPCIVRRSSFLRWTGRIDGDETQPPYKKPAHGHGFQHQGFSRYDDVMQCLEAIDLAARHGPNRWVGPSVSSSRIGDPRPYRDVAIRGLAEIEAFMRGAGLM